VIDSSRVMYDHVAEEFHSGLQGFSSSSTAFALSQLGAHSPGWVGLATTVNNTTHVLTISAHTLP